jgi:hypothetical protein
MKRRDIEDFVGHKVSPGWLNKSKPGPDVKVIRLANLAYEKNKKGEEK